MTQASSSELISSAVSLSGITQTSQIISPGNYYQSQQNPFHQPQPQPQPQLFQQSLVQQFQVHQPLTVHQILPALDQPTAQPVCQSLQPTIPQASASAPPSQQTEQPSAIPKIKRKDRSQGQSVPKLLQDPDRFYCPNCPRHYGSSWDLKVHQLDWCRKVNKRPWKCKECGKR